MPHVRFQVPFLGPESQLKSGFACAGLLCKHGTAVPNAGPLVSCCACLLLHFSDNRKFMFETLTVVFMWQPALLIF